MTALTRAELAAQLGSMHLANRHYAGTFARGHRPLPNTQRWPLELESLFPSKDGSIKFLWRLADGKRLESVLLPHSGSGITACISSQVGCALACSFCETGKMGLQRHLSVDEILGQIWHLADYCQKHLPGPLTHLVWMGMGEPLHNQEAVFKVLDIIRDPFGWSWSRKKIILSTAGWVPGIYALAEKHPVRLAVSLHTADSTKRAELMPVQKRFPLPVLLDACDHYAQRSGLPIFFEITLLKGINDAAEDALALIPIAERIHCTFNLIPYNPSGSDFERPEFERVKAFQHALVSRGITATIRKTAGQDVSAACGQLAV